jgi:hypothetical protein
MPREDPARTESLRSIVREIIRAAIRNSRNLIVEDIPADLKKASVRMIRCLSG